MQQFCLACSCFSAAALSTGMICSETSKPLAIVVIGGLISATLLTLFVFPVVFWAGYRNSK